MFAPPAQNRGLFFQITNYRRGAQHRAGHRADLPTEPEEVQNLILCAGGYGPARRVTLAGAVNIWAGGGARFNHISNGMRNKTLARAIIYNYRHGTISARNHL